MNSPAHHGKQHKRPHNKPNRANAVQDIFRSGPVKGLAVAAVALLLAAAAVVLFAVLQATVPCEFRPVTYAIFTGIVLASLGAIFGGQAGIRGKIPKTGVVWTVTGGAAFLVIVMAAVWWATSGGCKEAIATLKLSSIPSRYTVAGVDPSETVRHLIIRFDERVTVRHFARADHTDYEIYFSEDQEPFKIYLDLIVHDKAVPVCEISIEPAPLQIRPLLPRLDKFIPVRSQTERGPVEVKFKDGFLNELPSNFDAKSKGGVNACIQIKYFDKDARAIISLVDYVYFVKGNVALSDIWTTLGSASQFRVYAQTSSAQPPTLVSERAPEPGLDSSAAPAPTPPNPSGACPEKPSHLNAVLTAIKTAGVIGDDDLKAVYANWCNIEKEFFETLRIRTDNYSFRYNLVRFMRSSIIKIDICWASSDLYRKKNGDKIIACVPRLDQPRDLSRPLPFATTLAQKRDILDLLLTDDAPARREVEALLRSYPHDGFDGLFADYLANIDAFQLDVRLSLASAAIGYYYNRIVEKQWAKTLEVARKADADFERGRKWTDVMIGADRAASRARLYYARAHVLLEATSEKTPADSERIKTDFAELVRLSADEMAAYPYPWHIARANVYLSGKPEDMGYLGNFAKLSRQLGSKTENFNGSNYETSLKTGPNAASTEVAQLGQNDKIRVLMHFIPDANKKTENAWDFVWSTAGVGWIKLLSKTT